MDPAGCDSEYLTELHQDFAQRYKLHGPRLEQIWRSLSPKQRAVEVGADVVLKHLKNKSLGNLFLMIPERNLRDLTTNPEYPLDMLRHRATTDLTERYAKGPE